MPAPANPTVDYNVSIDSNLGSQRIDVEYSDVLIHQRESAFPYIAFQTKMTMKKSATSTIYWFDTRPAPETSTVTTGIAAQANNSADAITVPNPEYFSVNDVVEFPASTADATYTNVALVTAVGATTIDIRPHDPAKFMSLIANGATVNKLFTSYIQGSGTTTPSLTRPIRGTNVSTILRDSYQVAKTYENERLFAAPERARARAEKEIKHLVDLTKLIELSTYGVSETTYQTALRTASKGARGFIVSNVGTYSAALDAEELFDFMTTMHENAYGGDGNMNRRLVFASSGILSAISKLTLSGIRFQNVPTKWGASVTQIEWNGWTWDLVNDPQMTKFRQNAMLIIQPRYTAYRPFRPTQFRANIQNPEVDYVKDEFITEANYEHRLEEMSGYFSKA